MPIISVRDLVVEYEGRRILNGLNLDIQHGETMVLLGGSGSGKSTLLRQIIGLERPKSGSVNVKGTDITRCSESELKKIHRSIGVAFQSAALFNSLSVEDNVALPLREHTKLAPSIIDLVVWMKLAVVGLADFGKLLPHELILLLKETFQVTIIVVTHELPSAFRIADRIAMLYRGSFTSVGTKEEIKASQNPRVRQFLDRIPNDMARTPAVAAYFEKYISSQEAIQ